MNLGPLACAEPMGTWPFASLWNCFAASKCLGSNTVFALGTPRLAVREGVGGKPSQLHIYKGVPHANIRVSVILHVYCRVTHLYILVHM